MSVLEAPAASPTAAPTAATADTQPDIRIPALDGLRGLAILLIMQSHFYGMTGSHALGQGVPSTRVIDTTAAKIFEGGWCGVDLFFVLSGFLITGILIDTKSQARYFVNFYARRFLRIFPLYYGFLIFVFVVTPHIHVLDEVADRGELSRYRWWFWSYTYNIALSLDGVIERVPLLYGHFWSLAIEEQFYLVWPAVVLLLRRRQLMIVCCGLFVSSFVIRLIFFDHAPAPFAHGAGLNLTLSRTDSLGIGAFIALALRDRDDFARLLRAAPFVAAAALLALIAICMYTGRLNPFDASTHTIGITAFAALFGAVLVAAINAPAGAVASLFSTPLLRFFGKYSYGLYVIHLFVSFRLSTAIDYLFKVPTYGGLELPAKLLFNLEATVLSVAIAFLSWHLYEKQCLKLKKYFQSRTAAARSTAVTSAH